MLDKSILLYDNNILISHDRCKKYKIKFSQTYSNKILNEKELFLKMEENKELILAAAPIMNKIYNFVKGSNFFAIITANDGCILNVIGDETILSEAFYFKMIPGAYMDEKSIGTNAMGTSLIEKRPIQVSGSEHYINAYHRWTCSACPIRDTDGNILGTLDLTGYCEAVHIHTLGMVVAGARAIENELISNNLKNQLSNEKKHNDYIQNSLLMGLIIANVSGTIIKANSYALELFGYENNELIHMNVKDILKDWNNIKKFVTVENRAFNSDVDVYSKKNLLQLNLNAYPLKIKENDITNIILVFNEVKKQRKMADKIHGRQAIYTFDKIIGQDENFLNVILYAKKIADSKSNILIMGESGTGKELFAQSIHNHSKRANEPFIALNCGAIPRNLIEAELFGYDEGSFTGAKAKGNPGKFEIADGGTILLDEIGEMPLDLQTRLLRVIEEGTVSRIGSTNVKVVDVRVIAATNKNLNQEVLNGKFRKDLFYRLNVLPLRLPNLSERTGDIKLLIEHFMEKVSRKLNKAKIYISDENIEKLSSYNWPGNVRELENYIELAINTEELQDINKLNFKKRTDSVDLKTQSSDINLYSLKDLEKQHIITILDSTNNNITHAAQILGIGRNTLYRKLKEHEITVSE